LPARAPTGGFKLSICKKSAAGACTDGASVK
jgi:hypothetical protein